MDNESEYLIRNPNLALSHIKDLLKKKCILSVFFGENQSSFLTTLIDIDAKKKLLEFDCGPSEQLNGELLASPRVVFRTDFDGIKVSFSGKGVKQTKKDGEKIFVMPLPDAIFWMQRRQNFRVKIPERHTHCYTQFVVNTQYEDETGIHTIANLTRFKVADISVSGFAFMNVSPGLADYVLPPTEYKNCVLRLHDDQDSEFRVSFQIMNVTKIRSNGAIVAQRVGCKFTEMPLGFDAVIQRYIQDIELQNRNID